MDEVHLLGTMASRSVEDRVAVRRTRRAQDGISGQKIAQQKSLLRRMAAIGDIQSDRERPKWGRLEQSAAMRPIPDISGPLAIARKPTFGLDRITVHLGVGRGLAAVELVRQKTDAWRLGEAANAPMTVIEPHSSLPQERTSPSGWIAAARLPERGGLNPLVAFGDW